MIEVLDRLECWKEALKIRSFVKDSIDENYISEEIPLEYRSLYNTDLKISNGYIKYLKGKKNESNYTN